MARALVVLACAAAAAATRYTDYAGGKMPQYGGDYEAVHAVGEPEPEPAPAPRSDDYHGHSPDAPAALDYKYQEERHSKTEKPSKNVDDADVWRKVRRKQRRLKRPAEHTDLDSAGSDEDDEVDEAPRAWPSHSHSHGHGHGYGHDHGHDHAKRRPRLKSADDVPHPSHRRPAKYSRDRKIEISETRDIDSDDFTDDKSKVFDDDVSIASRDTTRKVNRRKARDRSMNFDDDLNTDEDVLVADRRMKGDDEKEPDYPSAAAGRRRPPAADERDPRERYRPVVDDDDDAAATRPGKPRQKIYDEYNDYYDMKRVQNIKHKLPVLLRRTSTVKVPTKTTGETELIHKLWGNRRLGMPSSAPAMPRGSDSESDSESDKIEDIVTAVIPTKTSSAALKVPTATTFSNIVEIISTSSINVAPANSSPKLSLAEKSRLSILKKALRKDGVKEESTKKPPVLLQVTNKLATVVMVEPPVSRQPWLPPHVLTGDSPERIDRVKKLMRHKLVAQAKSIQELTDNWDELVCDYIDLSLLDSGTPPPPAPAPTRLNIISFSLVLLVLL